MEGMRKRWFCMLAGVALLFVSACGGGDDDTPAPPPPGALEVVTGTALNASATGATLRGTVNPNGLDNVTAFFEWGFDNTLAGATGTAPQAVPADNTAVDVEETITFDPPLTGDNTVFFRIVASDADGAEVRGEIESFTPSSNPLGADAGDVPPVIMGQEVNLAGSASNGIGSVTYEWVQVAGTDVGEIVDNTTATPSFTAPDVSEPPSEDLVFQLTVSDDRGVPASDNVTVRVLWGLADDFSTDTSGLYGQVSVDLDDNPAGPSVMTYDAAGERLEITTADNFGLILSGDFPAPGNDNGVFSFEFTPIGTYPAGGGIWVRLMEDADTYYELAIFNWDDALDPGEPSYFAKVVGGVEVDNVSIPANNYDNVATRTVTITFGAASATAEGFLPAGPVNLTVDDTPIKVIMFEIQANQQDVYYDNIEFTAKPAAVP